MDSISSSANSVTSAMSTTIDTRVIPSDYTINILNKDSYLAGIEEKWSVLQLLTIYEMIHDFGGSRPPPEYRDSIRNYIDNVKNEYLALNEGTGTENKQVTMFGKKINLIFSSGNVEDFLKKSSMKILLFLTIMILVKNHIILLLQMLAKEMK